MAVITEQMAAVTAEEFSEELVDALYAWSDDNNGAIARIGSFNDEDLMSSNTGLVVHMADGSEFQLTIVRSR